MLQNQSSHRYNCYKHFGTKLLEKKQTFFQGHAVVAAPSSLCTRSWHPRLCHYARRGDAIELTATEPNPRTIIGLYRKVGIPGWESQYARTLKDRQGLGPLRYGSMMLLRMA